MGKHSIQPVLYAITLLLIAFICYGHESHKSTDFLFSASPTIMIPGTIQIAALGFKGDGGENYKLNFQQYQRYLDNLYKLVRPSSSDDEQSYVKYFLRYRIESTQIRLRKIEEYIAKLILKGYNSHQYKNNIVDIIVDDTVSDYFTEIYKDTFSRDSGYNLNRYAIFLMNPSFERIREHLDEMGVPPASITGYRWNYNNVPTNTWISKGEYVILDVTSHRAYIGPTSDSGVRSPLSILRLEECEENSDGRRLDFEASLGSAIHSIVNHVFFSELNFTPYTSSWDKVVVPIIVFKNHNSSVVEIDKHSIKTELRKIFHNDISLEIKFAGVHSLHDHKHLSLAVSKSLRTKVNHKLVHGRYDVVGTQYLDSKVLHSELKRSADLITETFLEDSPLSTRSQNQKHLPVFIFSLHGFSQDLLLEDSNLLAVSPDSVIILCTDQEKVPIPLYVEEKMYMINATDPNRHIIAGVAINQGVSEPHKRSSPFELENELDYSWAIGHHPFGPLSSQPFLSELFISTIQRNAVVSRVQKGISKIRRSVRSIDEFAKKYMHGVLEVGTSFDAWIDANYHGAVLEADPLLYTNTVDRLHDQVISSAEQLNEISNLLRTFKTEEAFTLSQSFIFGAGVFESYVQQELEEAEIRLRCCNIKHIPPTDIVYYGGIALGLTMFAATVPVFLLVGFMFYRHATRPGKVLASEYNKRILQ